MLVPLGGRRVRVLFVIVERKHVRTAIPPRIAGLDEEDPSGFCRLDVPPDRGTSLGML